MAEFSRDQVFLMTDEMKRGKITRFTNRSRRNLLSLVSKLDKKGVDPKDVLFITLTAPGQGG